MRRTTEKRGTKERVLELLEAKRGETVSGEAIAELLGVSRNAVWKAVGELRREGHSISAATNRGYCLYRDSDVISAGGIRRLLSQSCASRIGGILIYDHLDSTNKTAKELALSGAPHGTVVVARRQSSGRGRFSRSFFSPDGGLYMSVVLRPEQLRFRTYTAVTAFAAVSVCEAIEDVTGRQPKIKWVNDILIDGKKVCGILTEAVTDFESGEPEWIVVGIGINVYTRAEDFPRELRDKAASVCAGTGTPDARNRLAAGIMNRLVGAETPPDERMVFEKYKSRLAMLGKKITVFSGGEKFEATAVDIDPLGRLIAEKSNGGHVALVSGEIRMIGEN